MITLVLDNIRSLYNVGSILRTADGFGVKKVICVGITPYPIQKNDERLPHVQRRAQKQIAKTALGAEASVETQHFESITSALEECSGPIIGLEQAADSISIEHFQATDSFTLILGNEPNGLSAEAIEACENFVEIPMKGMKESFNVATATAIALYALTITK